MMFLPFRLSCKEIATFAVGSVLYFSSVMVFAALFSLFVELF
jgi:hypothetical protein